MNIRSVVCGAIEDVSTKRKLLPRLTYLDIIYN